MDKAQQVPGAAGVVSDQASFVESESLFTISAYTAAAQPEGLCLWARGAVQAEIVNRLLNVCSMALFDLRRRLPAERTRDRHAVMPRNTS